jgi:hypothetical protein
MSGAHFEKSPSSAHRWMRCPGSILLSRDQPERATTASDEGTLAHSIAADVLKKPELKGAVKQHPGAADLEALRAGNVAALQSYVDFVYERAVGCLLFVEESLDLSPWLGVGGFGTSDAVIYSPATQTLTIVDLKFGLGNLVFANERSDDGETMTINPQLGLYSLGAFVRFDYLDIIDVEMVVHQPRREHVSVALAEPKVLVAFGERVRESVLRVEKEPHRFEPGEKQCQWCPANAVCEARARWHLDAFAREVAVLKPEEVGRLLEQVVDMRAWCDALEQHARTALLADATAIPGWKMVEGRSVRAWNDEAHMVLFDRLGDLAYEKKLIGITAAEKLLGAEAKALMPIITVKPAGKPTLARLGDPRPAVTDARDGFFVETQ